MEKSDTVPGPPDRPGALPLAQASSKALSQSALLVFLGTLVIAVTGLLILVSVAPERFGFARLRDGSAAEAPPGDRGRPGERSSSDADGVDAAVGPAPDLGADSGVPADIPAGNPAGGLLGDTAAPVSEGGLPTAGGSAAEQDLDGPGPSGAGEGAASFVPSMLPVPFAERPSPESDGTAAAPRPVPRQPAPPTLAERIFADARPSVAFVATLSKRAEKYPIRLAGTGSGLVWDREGHIVTSRHVIENVNGANVTLSDGTRWAAELINVDDESDVAVLQINPLQASLTPIRMGTSADLKVGMTAFSVACPYALRDSLTSGLVSGLDRNIQTSNGLRLGGMIQTDVPMHSGSSGGALIDDQGRVIGMNTAVHLENGLASGVGFALPMDSLQEIVPRLIETAGVHWHYEFGFLTLSEERTRRTLLEYESYSARAQRGGGSPLAPRNEEGVPERGLLIAKVETESGAAAAGLRRSVPLQGSDGLPRIVPRDVVTGINGSPLSDDCDLESAIASLGPDEPLRLDIWRNGIEVSLIVERTATLSGR